MNQSEFTRLFCQKPDSFAWFLGAGASHNANLPTADDIITDLKRRFYNSEESQTYKTKDLQNAAVRETVEAFMQSRGVGHPRSIPPIFKKSLVIIANVSATTFLAFSQKTESDWRLETVFSGH